MLLALIAAVVTIVALLLLLVFRGAEGGRSIDKQRSHPDAEVAAPALRAHAVSQEEARRGQAG